MKVPKVQRIVNKRLAASLPNISDTTMAGGVAAVTGAIAGAGLTDVSGIAGTIARAGGAIAGHVAGAIAGTEDGHVAGAIAGTAGGHGKTPVRAKPIRPVVSSPSRPRVASVRPSARKSRPSIDEAMSTSPSTTGVGTPVASPSDDASTSA